MTDDRRETDDRDSASDRERDRDSASVRDALHAAPADISQLQQRLAEQAGAEDLVDVLYRVVDSPIGELLLAATPLGLVYVAFEVEDRQEVLQMLATRIGPRVLAAAASPTSAPAPADPAERALDDSATQLLDYLSGDRRHFDLPLDTRLATGFRGEVQQHLAEIDYGRTATYKELAAELERPGAVRAVGTACATNPLPLVWPCHRILRSDGGLGGYRGGLAAKQRLLAMESAA